MMRRPRRVSGSLRGGRAGSILAAAPIARATRFVYNAKGQVPMLALFDDFIGPAKVRVEKWRASLTIGFLGIDKKPRSNRKSPSHIP